MADRELGKGDMGGPAGYRNDRVDASAVDNCYAGTGTDNVKAKAYAEILCIGRGGNHDGIAGHS